MRTIITLFTLIIIFGSTSAQPLNSITVKCKVIDSQSRKPLIYATVYNINSGRGTVTNQAGEFILPENHAGDKLKISFIGYNDTVVEVNKKLSVIKLKQHAFILAEIPVLADNDYLYELLNKIRKKYLRQNAVQLQNRGKKAKTYFQLESFINNKRTELIEAYFNGFFNDYDVNEFHIKKGRVGIKPVNGNYFITSETSKAFYKHKLFYKTGHFPANPFQLNKRKLKNEFNLQLVGAFNDDGRKTFKIAFSPVKQSNQHFSGYVWIDISDQTVKKITLESKNAKHHPFLPYGSIASFDSVDLNISKTFQQIDDGTYIKSMDFDYTLHCRYASGETRKYESYAFIKPYNFKETFDLPLFTFSKSRHQDYHDITAMPYDKAFWDNAKDFAINIGNKEKSHFIEKNQMKVRNAPLNILRKDSPIHHFAYRHWQKERQKAGDLKKGQEKIKIVRSTHGDLDKQLNTYYINTKLFLDYSTLNDSTVFLLSAVIDPVETFHNPTIDNYKLGFINMYFDLLEIQKRKLHSRLLALEKPNRQKITSLYNSSLEEFEKTIDEFTKEVGHGKDKHGAEKWNQYINDNLGIDNIAQFNLFPPDKIYITGE